MSSGIKITVFGGGSFATALGYTLAKNAHDVVLLTRNEQQAETINTQHFNPNYLSDFKLPNNMSATTDPQKALDGTKFILHAIPVQKSFDYLTNYAKYIPEDVPIINSSKGLHIETLLYMSEIIPKALGRPQPAAFLSGPSFAKELMQNQPTAMVVASSDASIRESVQKIFTSTTLRIYLTDDVVGVEVGGALKNVFAIGAGIAEGLGLGLNSTAALVTRGVSEMIHLSRKMGGKPATLSGLSGVGDMMLTCFGALSRNRTVGKRLGQGEKLEDILASMSEVAEGVATCPAAVQLAAKHGLDLPIIKAVAAVIAGELPPREAVEKLMTMPADVEDTWADVFIDSK